MTTHTTNWCEELRGLGYDVTFKGMIDRDGDYWKITARHKQTGQCKTASDRLFARSTNAIAEKLYRRLTA